ncbi:hypothetical protein [Treponema sp.]|uniref:hypothetical protein n=1 Tax=Treponema sp. TaxID=166 RepID=UPI00298E41E9|nr:hypothetical protein [Treponema sp.]MCR5614120.1 hypothetical protein [Treponema sp.]
MKKIISILSTALLASALFAANYSYKDNTYQKLADEYTKKAEAALDAGEYDLSVEYAKKAEENAALSRAFIENMLARQNAEEQLNKAEKKLNWAKGIMADKNFPMAYSASEQAYNNAKDAYEKEDFVSAENYAKQAIAALEGVREVTPLPQFYVVRPWAETKDCYWNISGRKYVYNNPLLWENLYQKNKGNMPRPNDPNLILPGMKMEIPSLTGEYREGTYNPNKQYEAYSANR